MSNENSRYAIRRSASGGLGFFTLVPIAANRKIIEYTGDHLTKAEADKKGGKYLMTISANRFIDGSLRTNVARYINHSCRPNAKAYRTGRRVWIWSLRAIKAGEEIFYDYGEDYFNQILKPLGCRCEKCLKTDSQQTENNIVP